jgi:hypothetical protein
MIRIPLLNGIVVSVVSVMALASTAHAGIVINEVMYRPHSQLTIGRYEFTELYNNGSTTVDLGGALFTDSQDFTSICANTAPSDHEGVYRIPAGTSVAPGAYFTLWHASLSGITDQPGNLNYNSFVFFGDLVLNDHGDQVTVLRCTGTTPVILDSLNYATLGLGEAAENVSIERIDPDGPTQSAANWGFTTVAPGQADPLGNYVAGGTPGRANSLSPQSCPVAIVDLALSPSFASQLASANAGDCDGCSLTVDAYQFACPAGTPTLDDAVAAVFGIREFADWPWVEDGVPTVTGMTAELQPYYQQLVAPLAASLGASGEVVQIHEFTGSRLVAPGAHEWRWAYIVLFPQSHHIAVVEKIEDEI